MNYLSSAFANSLILAQIEGDAELSPLVSNVLFVFIIGVLLLTLAGIWATFEKHDKPGWASIVPFYNVYCLAEIAGYPGFVGFFVCIPLVGAVVGVLLALGVAKQSGRSPIFGLGLAFLPFIFYPVLGFSKD